MPNILKALGLGVTPSVGNFLLVHFPDRPGKRAADARRRQPTPMPPHRARDERGESWRAHADRLAADVSAHVIGAQSDSIARIDGYNASGKLVVRSESEPLAKGASVYLKIDSPLELITSIIVYYPKQINAKSFKLSYCYICWVN